MQNIPLLLLPRLLSNTHNHKTIYGSRLLRALLSFPPSFHDGIERIPYLPPVGVLLGPHVSFFFRYQVSKATVSTLPYRSKYGLNRKIIPREYYFGACCHMLSVASQAFASFTCVITGSSYTFSFVPVKLLSPP